MREIKNYVKVQSLEEAYQLNQTKSNHIIGGMLWLRTSKLAMGTAIDLCNLGLDKIEETKEQFSIGAMVSLRALELNQALNEYSSNAVRDAVKDIVGVQFRNMATVGGSIWGRFGFSDVLTVFLSMDTYVELYKGGIMPLKDFVAMKKDNDILVRIIVKKEAAKISYNAVRVQSTDFPMITCSVCKTDKAYRIAIGARPAKACLVEAELNEKDIPNYVASKVRTGSNFKGSAEYRKHLVKVLTERCLAMLEVQNGN